MSELKLSNSSLNKYLECPMSYKLRYKDRLVGVYKGSALFFGAAIDEALNYMLMNKSNPKYSNKPDKFSLLKESCEVFHKHWETQTDKTGEITNLPKNKTILYSKYDFDGDLLNKSDWKELFKIVENPYAARKEIEDKLKEVDFPELSDKQKEFYNFSTWLSLNRKGPILLEAYYNELLPQIEEVLEVQKEITLEDGSNKISGYVDLIVKMKDTGEIIVGDNKTSSIEYDSNSVESSAQLSQYKTMLNMEYGYNITKAGYFVVSKKLEKDTKKVCKSCGHLGQGTHKTCDNEVQNTDTGKTVRCNGVWDKTVSYKANTQLIIQEIPEHMGNYVLENYDTVIKCINQELFPRNFSSCMGKYGNRCDYYLLCHKNKMDNLIDKNQNKTKTKGK